MEQIFLSKISEADLGGCLKASEFQFKKKRMMFFRLLNSNSQDAKSLIVELTRSVADAVLSQQDEKSTSTIIETFGKGDKGNLSLLQNLFRFSGGEEGLWECASRDALSVSDSRFLSEIKTIPAEDYLQEAAIDVEDTAYTFLTKQVDTLVAGISKQILLTQKRECDKQVQREVDAEEARAVQILWSEFIHQIKDATTQHSTLYVHYGARNRLTTYRGTGAQLSVSTTSESRDRHSPEVCLNTALQPRRISFAQTDTYFISGHQESQRVDEMEYRIHLLHLRVDERQKVQLDPFYVPTPILENRLTHSFRVSSSTTVKYGPGRSCYPTLTLAIQICASP